MLTITAFLGNTTVTVIDTDDDGDSDDSTTVTLARGQSQIIRIMDGSVNDDAGGKWDGDHFLIDSNKPVTAMLSTHSEWQHDWVPGEGHTMRGSEFYLWSPRDQWDIDVVAYEDDTHVEIYRVSSAPTSTSGTTSVAFPGEKLLGQTIDRGEDLLISRLLSGANITRAGHTYRILTDKPATVMFGSFVGRERDGGGYVPSENGTTVGTHFYFPLISGRWQKHERELRIVAGDKQATVTVRARSWFSGWQEIITTVVEPYGHLDMTGRDTPLLRFYDLYEVVATEDINVFESNWLETGQSGTSDVISYVSALDSTTASDVGTEFVAYIGPPGIQDAVAGLGDRFSHLYIAAFFDDTTVTVTDTDTGGQLFSETVALAQVDNIADVQISMSEYYAMSQAGYRPYLRVVADKPISVGTANWNDNWLAFASGVVPAYLAVETSTSSPPYCNTTLTYTVTVTNKGTTPINNITLGSSPIGNFTLSTTPTPISTLAAGASAVQQVTGSIPCASSNTGDLAGICVLASGVEQFTGRTIVDKGVDTQAVLVPDVVGVTDVYAIGDACAIEILWTSFEDDGTADFVVLRRVFGSNDAYVEVGRVASHDPAESGYQYAFRDATASPDLSPRVSE